MTEEAHPLAVRLVAAIGGRGPVLVVGVGSGRNVCALARAGVETVGVDDDANRIRALRERFGRQPASAPLTLLTAAPTQPPGGRRFRGALSTHGLLHGAPAKIRAAVSAIRERLEPGGVLCATFGSTNDARCGRGRRIDDGCFAPLDGPESGVPHAYFSADGVRGALRGFALVSLEEVDVDRIVGRWAHGDDEAGMRHWFVEAKRSD